MLGVVNTRLTHLCRHNVTKSPIVRYAATAAIERATGHEGKREGDISDAFASLSGQQWAPLESRYAKLKQRLIGGHEDALRLSWHRLLDALSQDIPRVRSLGSSIIPEINYSDIEHSDSKFSTSLKHRGVAIVRNVLSSSEALELKSSLRSYIAANPQTKAYPLHDPQVYELYWSRAQMRARLHPNMLAVHRFLMSHWHASDETAAVSTAHPISYADRVRMRRPGDTKFALGPHVDGGSVERWEEGGYGRGAVYDCVFRGRWEDLDPWEISCRLPVKSDLYNGAGACSVFRCFQGWLSMSETGPNEGTLLVNPLFTLATAYYLLRPFFAPIIARPTTATASVSSNDTSKAQVDSAAFLHPSNWRLENKDMQDSWIHGATPGHGQELRDELHPHLRLDETMVHVPHVSPGDYVAWHCDTIHAVDTVHEGNADSSVLYIPASPLTEANAKYLARQRSSFLSGRPGPDFPGGEGEATHVGKVTAEEVMAWTNEDIPYTVDGLRAWGLEPFDSAESGLRLGQMEVLDRANKRLGFYG